VRCGRCGNENLEGNRFCGMCGASLVAKTPAPAPVTTVDRRTETGAPRPATGTIPVMEAPSVSTPGPGAPIMAPPAVVPSGETPRITPRPADTGPAITGPSFLGLNRVGEGRGGQDSLRHASGNLDYLLEDEEEPRRGWGKAMVVVLALALIGGFGYLRWKQGGFNFLKPAPAAQSSPTPSDSAGASGTAVTPEATAPKAASQDAANTSAGDPANPNAPAPAVAPTGTAPSGGDAGAQQTPPANVPAAASAPADIPAPSKPQDNASADKGAEAESGEDSEAAPAKGESAAPAAATKPAPTKARERKPTPATPMDPTAEAERYIYGRGAPQDCDRGLRLLKPAAAQANAKAMISLGTLYSIGTCTPRDLPTAYRWFALALHKQPDNQQLQDELQKLWSQMTQPERLLAIKLSQ